MRTSQLLIIATIGLLTASAQAASFRLFTFCQDDACTRPVDSYPYSVLKDGIETDRGITDQKGHVYTDHHQNGQAEDWLIQLFREEFALRLGKDGKSRTHRVQSAADDTNDYIGEIHLEPCNGLGECFAPYLWFKLYGDNQNFANEPYWTIYQNKVIASGTTNDKGYAFIRRNSPKVGTPLKVLFCSGAGFDISNSANDYLSAIYRPNTDAELAKTITAKCAAKPTALMQYAQIPGQFSLGRPFLHVGREYGPTPIERDQAKATAEHAEAQQRQVEASAYQQGKARFSPKTDIAPQGKCPDDLLGTFAVPANPPTANITVLAQEWLDPSYQAGQPAFKLTKSADGYTRTGLISGTVAPVTISRPDADEATANRPFSHYACVAHFDEDFDLVSVDYSKLSKAQLQEFAKYASTTWGMEASPEDVTKIHYFFAYTFNMTGVTGGVIFLPMQRLSVP